MESYNNDLFCCCWQFLLLLLLFAVELEPRKNFLTTFTEFGQFLSMLESWLNLKHKERNKTTTKMFLFVRFFSARIKVSVENVGDLISSCLIFFENGIELVFVRGIGGGGAGVGQCSHPITAANPPCVTPAPFCDIFGFDSISAILLREKKINIEGIIDRQLTANW